MLQTLKSIFSRTELQIKKMSYKNNFLLFFRRIITPVLGCTTNSGPPCIHRVYPTDREFSIEETRYVLQGGLPMPVEIGPAGRVGSSYKTRSQTPLPVTSLDTKTHQPSFFHGVLPQEPLRSSSISLPSETGLSSTD